MTLDIFPSNNALFDVSGPNVLLAAALCVAFTRPRDVGARVHAAIKVGVEHSVRARAIPAYTVYICKDSGCHGNDRNGVKMYDFWLIYSCQPFSVINGL